MTTPTTAPVPMLGSIMMFAGNYAPNGWMLCNGQEQNPNDYLDLYAILGTTYGGNGRDTFALPDMRGRVAVHAGQGPGVSNVHLGNSLGQGTVAINGSEMPGHAHSLPTHGHHLQVVNVVANQATPGNNLLAVDTSESLNYYNGASPTKVTMESDAIAEATGTSNSTGGTGDSNNPVASHNNIMPFVGINFIIAFTGFLPPPYT